MSYRLTRRNGLGQSVPPPLIATSTADPVGYRLAETLSRPILGALSSRLAYGKQPYGYYPSGFGVQTPYGSYGGGAYGGFNPQNILLIGGAGLLALMLMGRR